MWMIKKVLDTLHAFCGGVAIQQLRAGAVFCAAYQWARAAAGSYRTITTNRLAVCAELGSR